jgi:hypothetical protein
MELEIGSKLNNIEIPESDKTFQKVGIKHLYDTTMVYGLYFLNEEKQCTKKNGNRRV